MAVTQLALILLARVAKSKHALMWQEISDGNPGLVQVPLAEGTGACKGFVGLDHILLSEALNAKQKGGASSVKVGVDQLKGQKIISSDHCPRITTLKLR